MSLEFRYLNEEEMLEAGVADMKKCLNSMEDMFLLLDQGDYRMGGEDANEHGIRVSFPKTSNLEGMPIHKPDYRFMAMPAYLGGRFKTFGIKTYGSNPDNAKRELPRSILMMSLLDYQTGIPMAYMSANILSAMRTGAVSGIGTKYLCVKNPKVVSIIGPGTMSRYTMKAFIETQPNIETVKIKGRSKSNIDNFIDFCKKNFPKIKNYLVCESIEEACWDSDIIFFGTTNALKYEENPCIKKEWVKTGALVISASALLVDTEFWSSDTVKFVSDNYKMYDDWGRGNPLPTQKNVSTLLGMGFYDAVAEGKISKNQIIDIGEILNGEKTGRDDEKQIILYAVGGMPIEDVAWAKDVYDSAVEKGIGTALKVWDKPQL